MTQKELFELAKKLVIYSGVKKKVSPEEGEKTLRELKNLLKKLSTDTTSMGKQVKKFLQDIIEDIENGREINIDSINEDEYIENYLIAEKQVQIYNSILSKELYLQAINADSGKGFSEGIQVIKKQADISLKKLHGPDFAQMLLIISLFSLSRPKKYLKALYEIALHKSDYSSAKNIYTIIAKIDSFYDNVQLEAIKILEKGSIKSKFLRCDIQKNKLSFTVIDAAADLVPEKLYKKILTDI